MTHGSNIAIGLVLLASTRNSDEEYDNPRDPDFQPHLEVNRTNTRVQASTHEDVVDKVARHPDLVSSRDSDEVHEERDTEAPDHRHCHEVTKVVNDSSKSEDASVVEEESGNPGNIDATNGVALVHESLVA